MSRKAKRKCTKCGKPNPTLDRQQCPACLETARQYNRQRREQLKREGCCVDCAEELTDEDCQLRCRSCVIKASPRSERAARRAKLEALEAYGGAACACCGETQLLMLTIDHTNRNGAEMRRSGNQGSGQRIYRQLKKAGYPPGYRVLCRNCNYASYVAKDHKCPHRTGCFA
jgi:hypothetical protein